LTNEAKTVYDADLLKWKRSIYEKCAEGTTDSTKIGCKKFKELRAASEKARKAGGYYAKGINDRTAADTAWATEKTKLKATLTAAWLKDNKPAAGKFFAACSATLKCTEAATGKTACCGTATPKANKAGETAGVQKSVCGSNVSAQSNALGDEFTFKCSGAQQLLASAGAVLAAAYLL